MNTYYPSIMSPQELTAPFDRYAEMIAAQLNSAGPFLPEAESATAVQVERGSLLASLLSTTSKPDLATLGRLFDLTRSPERLPDLTILDRTGHHRPVYRGLLVYAALQSFRLVYESIPRTDFGRWEEGLRPWCDLLEGQLADIDWLVDGASGAIPAGRGSTAAEACWMALALHVAGKVYVRDAWTDLASATLGHLTRSQQPGGAFLLASSSDNPETHWYHELVLLHAAASYAVQAEDRHLAAAVKRNTEFHQAHTQPDHATTQPWGVFAFLWNPATRSLADQLLHQSQTLHPAGPDGISAILLADALLCLRLFLPKSP